MDDMTAQFNITCPICGKVTNLIVPLIDYADYISGVSDDKIAFPYLSENERKCITTRKCLKCQKLIDIIK